LNVSSATVIKANPGRLVRICVVVAGAAGATYDCATTGAASASNQVCVIPAAVGPIWLDIPCQTGIVVAPGASQVISVAYY
jgi:hypothetical protein